MKKIISILTILAILVSSLFVMAGCGNDDKKDSEKKDTDKNEKSIVAEDDDEDKDDDEDADKDEDKDNDEDKDEDKDKDEDEDEDEDKKTEEKKSDSSKDSKTDKNESSKTETDKKQTKSTDKTPIDLEDSSAYYFIVEGTKYKAGDKISKLTENGFKQSKTGAEKEIPANGYLIGGGSILNSDNKTIFDVTPINTTKEKIKGSEGQIGSFSLDKYGYEKLSGKAEIYGGITIGSSIEDVEDVFGNPTTKTDATQYAGPTYTYTAKAAYRSFTFRFNKDGKLESMRWQNYTFDK